MTSRSDISSAVSRFARGHWLDALVVALAVVAGVVVFPAFAHAPLDVGPVRVEVSVAPSVRPVTEVEVPPFGTVSARTHRGPVALVARVDEIDVEGTRDILENAAVPATLTAAGIASELPVKNLPGAIARIAGFGLAAALAVALLVALAARRGRAVVAIACASVLVAILVPVGVAAATWDVAAFREPTLKGPLAYVPSLVDVFTTRVTDIEKLRDQAVKVADDLAAYYADERSFSAGGSMAGTLRVLHVTDLHLDPVGAALESELVRSYGVSLIIDTGDLPILGTDVETRAFASLVDTSVPHVYVPGNHDSVATVAALRAIPGVTVVETGTVDVDGLRIFGVADPFSRGFGVEPDEAVLESATVEAFDRFTSAIASGETTPDIVALHNPAMEAPYVGLVPLILSGHTHSARAYLSDGTLRLNSGTLGGTPYDPAKSSRVVVPYGASVLYYTSTLPRRLIAVDQLAIYPDRSTTITRKVVDESLLP